MIHQIRPLSQQLIDSKFETPKDLVTWMGAMQAQDFTMAKWAIGIRLKSGSIQQVEDAINRGEIIRTHIMRPTWHFVPAEDLRWMLQLTGERVRMAFDSYVKKMAIPESMYNQCRSVLERILEGNNHLTKQEIGEELKKEGIIKESSLANYFLGRAEAFGLICSGACKGREHTYALIDERVPATNELHKDEALAKLATRYFSSHSPASFQDFLWWSGLLITEARQAIQLIESDLIKDRYAGEELFIHQSWNDHLYQPDETVHFLPPYDEYLISYKDRTAVLDLEHHPKAFNNYGIFQPVIMHNGRIVGNWKKVVKKGDVSVETSFFDKKTKINKKLIKAAEKRYTDFLSNYLVK